MRLFLILGICMVLACNRGPSDEKLQAELTGALTTVASGVTASVKEGVVTLTGTCPDESCRSAAETAAQAIQGVKSVSNNITVEAPPAPAPIPEIAADDPLTTSVNSLLSAYNTVNASVEDGVVTLTGEIKRSQLTALMQRINELKPKRVVNNLQIK